MLLARPQANDCPCTFRSLQSPFGNYHTHVYYQVTESSTYRRAAQENAIYYNILENGRVQWKAIRVGR